MYAKCRFLDHEGNPKGMEYTYGAPDDVIPGNIVVTNGKDLVITQINLPDEEGLCFGDKLKYVEHKPDEVEAMHDELTPDEMEVISMDDILTASEPAAPELDMQGLIVVEQLPVIVQRLQMLSQNIDAKIHYALSVECNEESVKAVKKLRADLMAGFKFLEGERIRVKREIMRPYDEFDAIYKTYVTDKYNAAKITLDERVSVIENTAKSVLEDDARAYFNEFCGIWRMNWLTWEQAGIKVNLSSNKTALRREVKEFIDRVVYDVQMIEMQKYNAEIMVEYKKTLNAAQAITTVSNRMKAIEAQKKAQEETESRRAEQEENRKRQAETLAAAVGTVEPLAVPAVIAPPVEVKKYSVAFKITDVTMEQVANLKEFLTSCGIEYQQIPLKNIMESE